MQEWQQRVINERIELKKKRRLLKTFLVSDAFNELPKEEQELLAEQAECMRSYLHILDRRIDKFKA